MPSINGNNSRLIRLIRLLNHGLSETRTCSNKKEYHNGTYYLLNDGRVISHREWYQRNKPNHVVSGSMEGCNGTKSRLKL